MHQAHKLLIGQASLIRSVFPSGLEMLDFQEKARQRSNTAGAPDVLNFLRNHVSKLNAELNGQPGAPAAPAAARATTTSEKKFKTSNPTPADPPAPIANSSGNLQDSVANLVRTCIPLAASRPRRGHLHFPRILHFH